MNVIQERTKDAKKRIRGTTNFYLEQKSSSKLRKIVKLAVSDTHECEFIQFSKESNTYKIPTRKDEISNKFHASTSDKDSHPDRTWTLDLLDNLELLEKHEEEEALAHEQTWTDLTCDEDTDVNELERCTLLAERACGEIPKHLGTAWPPCERKDRYGKERESRNYLRAVLETAFKRDGRYTKGLRKRIKEHAEQKNPCKI